MRRPFAAGYHNIVFHLIIYQIYRPLHILHWAVIFLFTFENITLRRSRNVFYLSYPQTDDEGCRELNEYLAEIGKDMKEGFEGHVGDEIIRFGEKDVKGYAFFDITCANTRFFSGMIIISGYSKGELIYFRCMPICLDASKASHIPLWSLGEKINSKEKNTPYCIINNTAYSVENLYSGQRIKLRQKNYRSLIRFNSLCGII